MASRDGTVITTVYLPRPLNVVVKRYQNARCLPSISSAIVELLETHERLALIVARIYDEADQKGNPERSAV